MFHLWRWLHVLNRSTEQFSSCFGIHYSNPVGRGFRCLTIFDDDKNPSKMQLFVKPVMGRLLPFKSACTAVDGDDFHSQCQP